VRREGSFVFLPLLHELPVHSTLFAFDFLVTERDTARTRRRRVPPPTGSSISIAGSESTRFARVTVLELDPHCADTHSSDASGSSPPFARLPEYPSLFHHYALILVSLVLVGDAVAAPYPLLHSRFPRFPASLLPSQIMVTRSHVGPPGHEWGPLGGEHQG
jgi:hypothetical protein